MRILNFIFVALSLFFLGSCLQIHKSSLKDIHTCKNLEFNFNLNKTKFAGTWYPLMISNKKKADCLLATFTNLDTNGMSLSIFNRRRNAEIFNFILRPYSNPNTFLIEWEIKSDLVTVLDTDYENYAILYKCKVKKNKTNHFAVIVARSKSLPEDMMKTLLDNVTRMTGITTMTVVRHSDDICMPNLM
jgi:hypothetical protein